jgi:1-acyl-sn-glycerol-3-phosphate acyltransferase
MSEITTPPELGAAAGPAPSLQVLRTRLFELAILLWSLPFGLAILTVFRLVRPPALVRRVLRLWSSGFILAARHIIGVRYRLEGTENLPEGPVVFVCNHQSYWESIAFTALFPHINVVTKAEAMDIPVFGWGLRNAPMIPVFRDRKGANLRRIVREARRSIGEGRSVLIFPEGTRVNPGCARPHLRGLELLYSACAVPLVPVVHNAGLCWSAGFELKRAGEVVVRFCPAIAPDQDARLIARRIELLLNREKDALLARSGTADADAGRRGWASYPGGLIGG